MIGDIPHHWVIKRSEWARVDPVSGEQVNGSSLLLNDSGGMCCLGQGALQAGATREELLGVSAPTTLFHNRPKALAAYYFKRLIRSPYVHTQQAEKCMGVNDYLSPARHDKFHKSLTSREQEAQIIASLKEVAIFVTFVD